MPVFQQILNLKSRTSHVVSDLKSRLPLGAPGSILVLEPKIPCQKRGFKNLKRLKVLGK